MKPDISYKKLVDYLPISVEEEISPTKSLPDVGNLSMGIVKVTKLSVEKSRRNLELLHICIKEGLVLAVDTEEEATELAALALELLLKEENALRKYPIMIINERTIKSLTLIPCIVADTDDDIIYKTSAYKPWYQHIVARNISYNEGTINWYENAGFELDGFTSIDKMEECFYKIIRLGGNR